MASRIGFVLAGGGARGAYEVGVIQYVVEHVARDLARPIRFDILSGTSIGALNATMLAAHADDPKRAVARLANAWTGIEIGQIVRPSGREFWGVLRALVLRPAEGASAQGHGAALFDPRGIESVVTRAVEFDRIDEMLDRGHLDAVSVSTTHVGTGRTVVFVDRRGDDVLPWPPSDPTVSARRGPMRVRHALASAAIPLVFPAVRIDGEYYCDGGLRQNVPLSPARRLGADGLLVVNPRHVPEVAAPPSLAAGAAPGPLFLLGKALNALLLDRIDGDVDRLERINAILDAGRRRFGPTFVEELNREMQSPPGRGVRPLRTCLVRASCDIGVLSADFVRRPSFGERVSGITARVMKALADDDASREADLLSYLLFDGHFAGQLIELGRADARAQHGELCEFFRSVERDAEGIATRVSSRPPRAATS
jgi:NTE family protein